MRMPGLDQSVMNRSYRQQHRDGSVVPVDLAVGEHHDAGPAPDRLLRLVAHLDHPAPQPVAALCGGEHGADPVGEEAWVGGTHDSLQLGIRQDRRRQFDEMSLLGGLFEQRAAPLRGRCAAT